MNKSDIAGRVATRTGLRKSITTAVVDTVFAEIGRALAAGEDVRIKGFGTFTTSSHPAGSQHNPRYEERQSTSVSKAPTFKAGKALKDVVNEP